MRLSDLTQHAGEWLRGGGPMDDVVISTRVRLARNLAGSPFLSRTNEQQRRDLEHRLRDHILEARIAADVFYVDLASAGELDRQLLVERHLISRQHAEAKYPRGVAVTGGEDLAIMVNEEDHLRIQVLRSGLQMHEAFGETNRVDDLLEDRLSFAYHSRYGYLTACPTNVGTGLRVSVMLHLPALKMTGEIEKVFRAATDLRLAVRGLYGEGTEAHGDFFQISNQTTLGKSEEAIVSEFLDQIVPNIIDYERRARESLIKKRPLAIKDKVHRAAALLRSACLMGSDETMYLLSLVRLGLCVGCDMGIDMKTVNELFLLTQPAHLQKIHSQDMDAPQRGQMRAEFIRRRLGAT